MVVLYHGSGARDFEILGEAMGLAEWARLKTAASALLAARGSNDAATLLGRVPFGLCIGTNVFGDDFSVLVATVSLEAYVELSAIEKDRTALAGVRAIVDVLNEIGPYVRFVAIRLDSKTSPTLVASPSPRLTTAVVERALKDAESLLQSSGATSAVDRAHTALHGYMRALCDDSGIPYASDAALTDLFKRLREQHPKFGDVPHAECTERMVRSLSSVVDAANMLRNRGSLAHPNDKMLQDPEAILVINCVRTVLHYLDAKTR